MVDFPTFPVPSSVSAPAYIDPILRFQTDSSVEIRRSRHSRPRRQYQLDFLGKSTHEMRLIRGFLEAQRFGALPFSWWHSTAEETVTFNPTTPIVLNYGTAHGLMDGQWVGVFSSPSGNAANGFYQITLGGTVTILLNDSANVGAGIGTVRVYLPKAVARFSDDTYPSPVRLDYGGGEGQAQPLQHWSWSVTLEEDF